MDSVFSVLFGVFGDGSAAILGLLVFLAVGTLTFCLMTTLRVRGAVKRRAAGITLDETQRSGQNARSLRHSSLKAVQRLLEYTTKHYSGADGDNMRVLRRRLVQAGIYDPRAIGYFFLARIALAAGLAGATFVMVPTLWAIHGTVFWMFVAAAALLGYVVPSIYIDKRIKTRQNEHRSGFPDFMDLLVVCAESGLSMEASLTRVGSELGDSYPSLSANIHMTNLEIRAGRTVSEALEHFADRLGLEEARSFATLIQQSDEIGSSITDALRVYSDDMRHKRLSRAEEKAYALPAKLTLPMMICIFPVLFVVILLPVIVRVTLHKF
ncbi:MAG: type II secretion system F family protein [Xanthobacteraceae bacterium]